MARPERASINVFKRKDQQTIPSLDLFNNHRCRRWAKRDYIHELTNSGVSLIIGIHSNGWLLDAILPRTIALFERFVGYRWVYDLAKRK